MSEDLEKIDVVPSDDLNEESIKNEEDTYFLKSILPKDENEKRRVINSLHRTYLNDGKRK